MGRCHVSASHHIFSINNKYFFSSLTFSSFPKYPSQAVPINPSIDTAICECGDECDVAPNLKLLSHWCSSAAPMHITQIHTVSVNIRYEVNIVNVVHCRDIEAILSVLVCWYGKVDIVNIVGILRRYYQQEQSVCSAATSSASWSLLLVLSTCSNAASLLSSSSYQYLK